MPRSLRALSACRQPFSRLRRRSTNMRQLSREMAAVGPVGCRPILSTPVTLSKVWSGWNKALTAYCCTDGTAVTVKRQDTVLFVQEEYNRYNKPLKYDRKMMAIGPRNGVAHKFVGPVQMEEHGEEYEEEQSEEAAEQWLEGERQNALQSVTCGIVVSRIMTTRDCRRAIIADKSLENAVLPETVEIVGGQCFSHCNIKTLHVPSRLQQIVGGKGDLYYNSWDRFGAFHGCGKLQKISYAANAPLKDLGRATFYECGITSVSLPEGLQSIGRGSFCRASVEEVSIPSSVAVIEQMAFGVCRSL